MGRSLVVPPSFLVIANPNAGHYSDELVQRACRVLACSSDVEVAVTATPADVVPALERLADRQVLILGGDGTNNVVVNALGQRGLLDRPVGLLPAGTADAFASGIGLPRDIEAAADRITSGLPRPLDLIEADPGRLAVNDAHTGVGSADPTIVSRLKPVLRSRTYSIVNGASALLTRGWGVTVHVDQELICAGQPVLTVAVGNAPLIGDGTPMWPGARPDDGQVDVVVVPAIRRRSRPALARDVLRGHHVQRDDVIQDRGREVHIVGGPGAHNADGEQWPDLTDVTYRVRPAGWQLLM